MTDVIDTLMSWARANPWPAAAVAGPSAALLLYLLTRGSGKVLHRVRRRATVPVTMAAFGAVLATGLSSDTAWRFASTYLGIDAVWERVLIFAIGEVSLFTFGLAARANLNDPDKGRTGVPGVMVWVTCAVLAVPALAVSDSLPAALVRILLGPCAAAVLWHMAMGIELRQSRPKTTNTGFLAVLGNEARERTLARFGLADRNQSAEQIIRERATIRVAVLAERYHALKPAQTRRRTRTLRRLQRQMLKAGIATDTDQRKAMLSQRAHLQHAAGPAVLASPWAVDDGGTTVKVERVKADQAVKPELLNEAEPVKSEDDDGVKTGATVNGERPESVNTGEGVKAAHQGVNAFTVHSVTTPSAPAWSAVNEVNSSPQEPSPGARQPFHPAAELYPLPPDDEASAQFRAMNPEVNEPASRAPQGRADEVSIRQPVNFQRPPEPWDPAPGEGVHPAQQVNGYQAFVPAQPGPVNTPHTSSPAPVKGEDEEGVKAGTGVHPSAGVNDEHPGSVNGEDGEPGKPNAEQARKIIEARWWDGASTNAETAREAQRAPSRVTAIWKALEEQHGRRPLPG